MTGPTRPAAHRATMTRAQERTFREYVIADLRIEPFKGMVRAYAKRLMDRHGSAMPFDKRTRVERCITKLAHEHVIAYTWGKSGAYNVVVEIRLMKGDALEPDARRMPSHIHRLSADDIERRQMEILATLEHCDGRVESIVTLERAAAQHYGQAHEHHTSPRDLNALKRCVRRFPTTIERRPAVGVDLTDRGREVLAKYRKENGGVPNPPGPDDVRTRTAVSASPPHIEEAGRPRPVQEGEPVGAFHQAASASPPPASAAAPRTKHAPSHLVAARDAAIDVVLHTHGGSFRGILPLARETVAAFPIIGNARAVETHIQQRIKDGTLYAGPHKRRKPPMISFAEPVPTTASPAEATPTLPVPAIPAAPTTPSDNGASAAPPQSGDPAVMLADVERQIAAIAQERTTLDERQRKLEAARDRAKKIIADRDALAADLRQ